MIDRVYSLEELKNIISKVLDNYSVSKAILFGSYAKDCANEKSDIDLVIDSNGNLLNISFYGLLEDLVEKLNKRVDLLEISEIKEDSEIYRNIMNEGVVIYER